jgi:hypothetical protein
MSSSSSLPSAIEQHEQQDSLSQNTGSSVSQSQGVLTSSSTSSHLILNKPKQQSDMKKGEILRVGKALFKK